MRKFLFFFFSFGILFFSSEQAFAADACHQGTANAGTCRAWCGSNEVLSPGGQGECKENWTSIACCTKTTTPTLPPSSSIISGYCAGDCVSSAVSCDSDYNNIGRSTCNYTFKCCVPRATATLTPTPTQKINPTATPRPNQPTTPPSGGGNPPRNTPQPTQAPQSCPIDGDSCYYMEGDKCYSGHGADGINKDGCIYSCGPVDVSLCKEKETKKKENKNDEPVLDCTPGEPVGDCSDAKCPDSKNKKCHGYKYCVWDEDGTNYASACTCEESQPYCDDKKEEKKDSGGSCKDNPTSPPDGYTWKNSCKSCGNNDDCPRNTKDGAVNPDSSNWCFGGSCLMLVTKSGGSSSKNDDKKKQEEKDKKKKEDEKKKKQKEKDVDDGITKDDTGNRTKQNNEKTARDKAQKPIDKLNKDRKNQGLPTLTPLPQDWKPGDTTTPTKGPSPTIAPTPLPPLPEPENWQGFCGQTTNPAKPWGIRVSWNGVNGAARYAVRIDEDAPSWEGDTPSVGDTVDNQVKDTVFVREAKPGAIYQWWVHSINASGVYSGLSKKVIIKCPQENPQAGTGTPKPQSVGAGQLIVLP